MRRPLGFLGALLALMSLPASLAGAQESATIRIGDVGLDAFPDVRVEVAVPVSAGAEGLEDAFTVREEGEAREVLGVRQASSSDLQVALVIDTSGSMGIDAMNEAKEAATSFLDQLPEAAKVAVLSYASEVTLHTDFEATHDEHDAAIDALVANGNTAMYDGVLAAIDAFPEPVAETKQAVVLLTDGADTVSEAGLDAVTAALEAGGVTLRGIAYKTEDADDTSIAAMAEASQGSWAEADDQEALNSIYDALAAELTNRYLVDYRSDSAGDTEIAVELALGGQRAVDRRTIELPALPAPVEEESEVAVAEPAVPSVVIPDIDARPLLYSGAVLWFVALAVILATVLAPRERRAQLWGAARRARGGSGREFANRAAMLAERSLERRGYQSGLNAALERAGIDLRPGEFIVLTFSVMVTAGAVGWHLDGLPVGALMALAAAVGARLVVSAKTSRRQAKFADQLGDTLQLLSGSLRAGYSFLQAVDAVAREADSPSSQEFSRLVVENRLGRDFTDALHAMAGRMQSEDFEWVVQAIEIHREVGGDLAEVLDTVAGTIRERNQIRRQVKALSAEGRLSAWVLALLPVAVGFMIYLTNRPYIAELTNGGLLGWGLLGTAAVLMTAGIFWLRSVVKLEF
ncbi:type II secretion system F family protein [Egicoccus sp. AB-alg2]|uniref:type II secretion system F family protein n=1 Tax=Egicoccus sp. AB-alg2 TaxID=3242693 RepID=UPI00359EB627